MLIVFGVQQMPAGRSAIIAYTLPVWTFLFSLWLLHEPLSGRKLFGLVLGMCGLAVLLGEEVANVRRAPIGTLLILGAAVAWGFGTVLLRRWAPPLPQSIKDALPDVRHSLESHAAYTDAYHESVDFLKKARASGLAARVEAASVPFLPGAEVLAEAGEVPGGTRSNERFLASRVRWPSS